MTASVDTPRPADPPGAGGLPLAGCPAAGDVSDVDRRIAVAWSALGTARTRFADAPSGDGVTACVTAEATVNELLDLRLALTVGGARLAG